MMKNTSYKYLCAQRKFLSGEQGAKAYGNEKHKKVIEVSS